MKNNLQYREYTQNLVRNYYLQKQAADEKKKFDPKSIATTAVNQLGPSSGLKDYAIYGGVGAGVAGALGAAIQAARKKSVLKGLGIGAGIGGTLGLGTRATLDVLNKTNVITQDTLRHLDNMINDPEYRKNYKEQNRLRKDEEKRVKEEAKNPYKEEIPEHNSEDDYISLN